MLRVAYQSVNSSAHLDTNQRLSDLQVSQIMTFTSGSCSMDAVKSLQYSTFMRNRNRSRFVPAPEPFWLRPTFQTWKSTRDSSLVMIKGNHASRFNIKGFCVNAISLLRDSKVPVLWALKTIENDAVQTPSIVDLLKSLVCQALRLNDAVHSERSMAFNCTKFQRAETENQWLELLGSVVAGLPQVYVIIDVEAVSPRLRSLNAAFSWPNAFLDFFSKLTDHGCKTVVKVVLVSYGSSVFVDTSAKDLQDLIISVGRPGTVPMRLKGRTVSQQGSWSQGRGVGRGRAQSLAF